MGTLESQAQLKSEIKKKIKSLYFLFSFLMYFFFDESSDVDTLKYRLLFIKVNYHLFYILKFSTELEITTILFHYKNYHCVMRTKKKKTIKKRLKKKLYKRNSHFLL